MPLELIYQNRFDRSCPRPTITLLELHTQFEGQRGRVLEYIRSQEEISVSLDVFTRMDESDSEREEISDHEKYLDWLRVHAKGKVTVVSHKKKFPINLERGIWCFTGTGKTARVRQVRAKFPSAREVSAESLIRGELGETQRRLQRAFTKFPVIVWDDIDLTLGTEGRIVKEVVSDLVRILENFQGLFVFSAETREAVGPELSARVSEWNPEISTSL